MVVVVGTEPTVDWDASGACVPDPIPDLCVEATVTADPLAIESATLAGNWPYTLIGQRWNLQHDGYFSTTGEIVAIHTVDASSGKEDYPRFFFVRTDGDGLAVIPESSIQRYYRDAERKEIP